MRTARRLASAAALCLLLAACSKDGRSTPPVHEDGCTAAPTADAGPDQAVSTGALVALNGTGSHGSQYLRFRWSFQGVPTGSTAVLVGDTSVNARFVADRAGEYVLALEVTNDCGTSYDSVLVTSTGTGGGGNRPPVAHAGPDAFVPRSGSVQLLGSASDPDGDTLSFWWTFAETPAGATATIVGADTADPTLVYDRAGAYTLTLTVTDPLGATGTDSVVLTARNGAPAVWAGADAHVARRGTVTLSGTATDPDGDALTLAWAIAQQPAAATASLAGASTATATLTFDGEGAYTVSLTATDPSGASTTDLVVVTATNQAPVATVSGDSAAELGGTAHVSATATDADEDPVAFAWTLTAPAGSAAALSSATAAAPTFVPDVAGVYRVTVVASDGTAASAPVSREVEALPAVPRLAHGIVDAEYSASLDRIVTVSAGPNALHVIDPATSAETVVPLPLAPVAVSVSPDGKKAAVAHNAVVSYVDLEAPALVKTLAVTADPVDLVLAGNGYVYVFPRVDQWVEIHCLKIADGTETLSGSSPIRAGTVARLHPGGTWIYGADNGLSPADIEKYDISGGTASFLYDSPYHGDYAMCGDLWITEDGARIITACANTFRSSALQADDMRYAGTLAQGQEGLRIRFAAHSSEAGKILVIPAGGSWYGTSGPTDREIRVHGAEFLVLEETIALPRAVVGGRAFDTHGRFVFFSADGTRRYALLQIDASAALLKDAALLAF